MAVELRGVTVTYRTDEGEFPAVNDVDLDLPTGVITGIVGESGSGKSTLALAVLGATTGSGRITAGTVHVDRVGDVTRLKPGRLRRVRGTDLSFVFQASQNSLNPLRPVGKQLLDLGRSHGVRDRRRLLREAKELAERMGLDPHRVMTSYQHELSGGMRQRVGIIFALVLGSPVLILDEPTTALDMISQSAVLSILRTLHEERGLTTALVTHDIGIVAELTDRMVVMYAGRIVEEGPTGDVLTDPKHPYTQGLVAAIPRVVGDMSDARPLPGSPPDLTTIPAQGCVFFDRCPLRMDICELEHPPLVTLDGGRRVACHMLAPPRAHAFPVP